MEEAELNFLNLLHLDMEKLERKYIMIEMEGKPFRVRTLIYGKKEEGKKTLCMTHGYLGNSTGWMWMFKPLAEHYRLVCFDLLSWGLNTKLDQSEALENPETSEKWMREWVLKYFDAITEQEVIPDKVFLAAHSLGAFVSAQYASQRPDRIEGLFLMSPAGTDPYDEATWDPYSLKNPDDLRYIMPKAKVDKIIKSLEEKEHPLAMIHYYP